VPEVGFIQQEAQPAAMLVAPAQAPDGGAVAFHAGGHGVDRLARGDGEDDAGMLNLKPG
jgi:hypothetical protein